MGFNKDKDNEVDGAQISHNGLTRSLKSGALGVGTMSHHVLLQYIYSVPKVATSDPQKSSIDERGDDDEGEDEEDKENMYEEAFARMKRAAGVSEIDEVVHR